MTTTTSDDIKTSVAIEKRKKVNKFLDLRIEINKAVLILCIPLFSIMCLDYFLTLTGQPPEYWVDHTKTTEEHIIGRWLLERDWLLFVIMIILWLPVVYILLKAIRPYWLRSGPFIYILMRHTEAASGWLDDILKVIFKNLPNDWPLIARNITQYSFWIFFIFLGCWAWEKHRQIEAEKNGS